jgi:hypothetical protein
MRILRHQIAIHDYQVLTLPSQGELLSVAKSRIPDLANHAIDLWSLDHESGPSQTAGVYVIGTGNLMPVELQDDKYRHYDPGMPSRTWRKFLGTVVTPNNLVWHVFGGPVQ